MITMTATAIDPNPVTRSGHRALATLADLAVSFGAPLLAYHLIRPHTATSAAALVLSGAIPVLWTLGGWAVTRKMNPIALVGVASFALGAAVSWVSGGNTLAIELEEPVVLGLAGLVLLGSVAIGRPLHPVILRWLSRGDAKYAAVASRARHRSSMIITGLLGATLVVHSAAVAVLALTTSTATFVALQRPVGLGTLGLGIAVLFWYRGRMQARKAAESPEPPESAGE
jgi:hypothetical protein